MTLFVGLTTGLACTGVIQVLIAWRLVVAFVSRRGFSSSQPPVTVLKPLHGDEPLLEQALITLCQQHYPQWQIVFGVQDRADAAIAVVERLRTRFPVCEIDLVVDPTLHGANRKVGNLINMLPAARYNILVIADSDIHVCPSYLDRLVGALSQPGIGLVTTLYVGLPAWPNLPARLGAMQITHGFLLGALLARAMGRQDCLGATMCLRQSELARIGGLRMLVDHLADDNVLGRRIKSLGLGVALASTVPLTTVPEAQFSTLFRHELRWARTIRALEPLGFAASILQYSLFWAMLAVLATAFSTWSLGVFATAWTLRALVAAGVDRALATLWTDQQGRDDRDTVAFSCPVWLLPLRDVLSVIVLVASYAGRQVVWRGHRLHADTPPLSNHADALLRPTEGMNPK